MPSFEFCCRFRSFGRPDRLDFALAKIVFAVQSDLSKRLVIPADARLLRVVWDNKPLEPETSPIQLTTPAYNYGGKLHVRIEPEKPFHYPGDVIRATITLLDLNGQRLSFSEFDKNGIHQLDIHLAGPAQDPTYYHD